MFILLFTPGDLYNAIPIYLAQGYLLLTVSVGSDYKTIRTATTLHISASIAAAVAAYATAVSTSTLWEVGRSYIHLGVMVAVAILMTCSSVHVLNNARRAAKA